MDHFPACSGPLTPDYKDKSAKEFWTPTGWNCSITHSQDQNASKNPSYHDEYASGEHDGQDPFPLGRET